MRIIDVSWTEYKVIEGKQMNNEFRYRIGQKVAGMIIHHITEDNDNGKDTIRIYSCPIGNDKEYVLWKKLIDRNFIVSYDCEDVL